MVAFKAEPTRIVTHVMHFGEIINSVQVDFSSVSVMSAMCFCRVGGVLKILGVHHFIDRDSLRAFLLTCQSKVPLLHFLSAVSVELIIGHPFVSRFCLDVLRKKK